MKTVTMLADSPQEAVLKARQQYGPQAVIQEVRQHSAKGISRFWRKPKLELLIRVPDAASPDVAEDPAPVANPIPEPSEQDTGVKPFFQVYQNKIEPTHPEVLSSPKQPSAPTVAPAAPSNQPWRVEPLLRNMGLSDYWISEILDRLALRFRNGLPDFVRDELAFCRSLMMELLPSSTEDPRNRDRPVVLLGTPGSGKTTVLCKWMAHLVFQRNLTPAVWRLDGNQPNTAEMLEVYAEMLQAPLSRFPQIHIDHHNPLFIDLPGVSMHEESQLAELESRLQALPQCDRYLVLNACYNTAHLNQQLKAFERFKPRGIIFSHLDEETQWGRLLNLFLGTNCPVSLLSGGQNIPGTFETFRPAGVLSRVFPSSTAA